MKQLLLSMILLAVLAQLSFTVPNFHRKSLSGKELLPQSPALSITQNVETDIVLDIPIPCTGETVHLEGTLHSLFHYTANNNNVVIKDLSNPQGLSGVSSESGTLYQGTGVTQSEFKGSLNNGQTSFTFVNNFRIIGQGADNNYLVHENVHVTINANNTLTVDIDNFSIECK